MSNFIYFQKYHSKENVHSSNVLYILQRVYHYNPTIFYNFLNALCEEDVENFMPQFLTQEKGKRGITDFSIIQGSFKIIVEAKEKYNKFDEEQIRRHLSDLEGSFSGRKFFFALSPNFIENNLFDALEKDFPQVKIKATTYLELYENLFACTLEIRDYSLREMLEEFKEYCISENLVDETGKTIMIRLAGNTLNDNIKSNIYYDKATNYLNFRYLGLYKGKQVQYIGKINHVINARQNNDGTLSENELLCVYPSSHRINDSDKKQILSVMNRQKELYQNTSILHSYYFVEEFVQVEGFTKSTKGALYGKKKFYLDQFNLKEGCSALDIANEMKNKTWEEIEKNS